MLSIDIVSSWFPELNEYGIVRFVRFYTKPYFDVFRKIVPPLGPLDLSPIVAFFALNGIEFLIKRALFT